MYPYFAEYNLREEYINTYRECIKRKAKLTEEDCKLLQENLSYISEDTIKNAKNIKKGDIGKFLKLKKNPHKLEKNIKR